MHNTADRKEPMEDATKPVGMYNDWLPMAIHLNHNVLMMSLHGNSIDHVDSFCNYQGIYWLVVMRPQVPNLWREKVTSWLSIIYDLLSSTIISLTRNSVISITIQKNQNSSLSKEKLWFYFIKYLHFTSHQSTDSQKSQTIELVLKDHSIIFFFLTFAKQSSFPCL